MSVAVKAQNDTLPPVDHQNSRDTVGVFDNVDVEAQFPGGDKAWRKYLEENFNVSEVSDSIWKELPKKDKRKTTLLYTAIVQFIVCKDGAVCEVKTINNVPAPLKKEAERLITLSAKWEPAEQNNKKVKAYRRQPITLQITE
jgi:periplasmic protein TonB